MSDSPNSLYAAWLGALPQAFRMLVPGVGQAAAPPAGDHASSQPFPADQMANAAQSLSGILSQLYQDYLPLLAKGDFGAAPLMALAEASNESLNKLLESWAAPAFADGSRLMPWTALFAHDGVLPAGAGQLQLGIERSFGGVIDAFGLRPTRELEQAWREMLA